MILNPLTYAFISQESYHAVPQIGDASSSARAIVEQTIDGICFGIPGTNNFSCFLTDIDMDSDDTILGPMHCGFNKAALEIVQQIEKYVTAIRKPFVLCGHSEGAALALILGGYLCKAGRPPLAVFGFEPPQVTSGTLLGTILSRNDVKVLLTKNGNDVVPDLPPILGFRDAIHPFPLTPIGRASRPYPNVIDHQISRVVEAVHTLATL